MGIPVCTPTQVGNERKYVMDCMDTNWISSSGKYIEKFEKAYADWIGTKYAITCTSGTTALHLALASLGIGSGDEVIVPEFSIIATANAVLYCGAKPVFVDSELKTWNMDIDLIEEKITKKTKAIIVVHTYGCPMDMGKVMKLARKHGLYVVEDAAEAQGATYRDKLVGGIGHVGCFSFYGNKILTTGEGGMVTTNDAVLDNRIRSAKNHYFGDMPETRFFHVDLGFNYRMTNIQAAIGLAQTEYADVLVWRRIRNALQYNKQLKDVKGLTLPPICPYGQNVYWMYGILVEDKKHVMEELAKRKIGARSFFMPMSLQPVYYQRKMTQNDSEFVNALHLWQHGLYLPSASNLTKEQITEVCDAIKEIMK